MSDDHELEASFRALVEESRRQLGEPPTSEQLLAYHRGELPAEEAERIRERLACDRATLDRLLDLTAHVPDPDGPDHLSDEDLAEDWAVIRSRLRLDKAEEKPRPAKVVPFPSPRRRQIERYVALAAGLAFAVLGFQLRSVSQQKDEIARRLAEPRVNQKPYTLLPDGRRGSGEPPIRISLAENGAHLSLALYDLRDFDDYRLEVRAPESSEGSEPLWTTDEIVQTGDDAFEIGLPPGFLPPGEYLFRIYGIADGQAEELASYSVLF